MVHSGRRQGAESLARRSSDSAVFSLDQMAPYRRSVSQSFSWRACRSSSVALATSWVCRESTSGRTCCTVELDRLTVFPLPNFGLGILTRCTSLNQDSMVSFFFLFPSPLERRSLVTLKEKRTCENQDFTTIVKI